MSVLIAARGGLMAAALTACAADTPQYGADAAPAVKLERIALAAREPDPPRRWLVEQLDSDDPAVRSSAFAVLARLSGNDFGYRPEAPVDERSAAVARWVRYVLAEEEREASPHE